MCKDSSLQYSMYRFLMEIRYQRTVYNSFYKQVETPLALKLI